MEDRGHEKRVRGNPFHQQHRHEHERERDGKDVPEHPRHLVQMAKQQREEGEPEGRGNQRGRGRQVDVLPIRKAKEGDRRPRERAKKTDRQITETPAAIGIQVLPQADDPGQEGGPDDDTGVGVAEPQRREHPAPRQQEIAEITVLPRLQDPLRAVLDPDAELIEKADSKAVILAVGSKGRDYFQKRGFDIISEYAKAPVPCFG